MPTKNILKKSKRYLHDIFINLVFSSDLNVADVTPAFKWK